MNEIDSDFLETIDVIILAHDSQFVSQYQGNTFKNNAKQNILFA
jgi:hypothetical protein